MNVIYNARIGNYLKIFAGCLLLVGLAIKPGKSSAQTCTTPGTVTALSSDNISCSSFLGNWNAPSGTVTNYIVELASDPGFVSIVFGPIETGSTATSFSFTGLNAGVSFGIHTYYMRVMAVDSASPTSVCNSAGWSDTVITNLPAQSDTCQCTAVNDLTCATDYISNVTINTLNNNTGCSTGGYAYYFHTGANAETTNLAIASTYSLSVSTGGTNPGTFGAGVWFDFNQNGSLMDEGEFLPISSAITTGATALKAITIPADATPGFTTMRVRYGLSESMVQSDACTMLPNTVDGETEDYSVCLYVPTNISLLPQNTLTCVGSTPVLFLGATGSGLTYQWYSNTVNSSTGGTPIPGATNSNYTPVPPVTTTPGTYYYYCVLTNICGTTITTPSPLAASLTVNPLPIVDSITANPHLLCIGNPLTLIGYGATGVGTPTYDWSGPNGYSSTTSSDTSIYTPISIAATGIYSLTVVYPGAGCTSNEVITPLVTVNDSPSVAGVTANPTLMCAGSALTLISGATTGSGTASSYIWSGPNGFRDTTLSSTITLTLTSTADSGIYSLVVTYPGNGCYSRPESTLPVEIDTAAAAITGIDSICYLGVTTFSNTTAGGTWTSSNVSVATINGTTGAVVTAGSSGGTTNIVYTVNNACGTTISNLVLTVNPLPAPITGNIPVCNGLSICLSDATNGGTWVASNGNVTIGSTTGCITGVNAGTVSISYTLPTTCFITTVATINPLPATISGSKNICLGFTASLTDATPGGSWSSSSTSVASISTSGIVSGLTEGTSAITYTLPTGCIESIVVTVNPNPLNITGTTVVCATQTTSLTDATTGGTWSSSSTSQATVGTGGIVTGVSAGTPIITYALPTGCIATTPVTVNPLSAISGTPIVCQGLTLTLTDATPGGTWSSSNTSTATIGTNGIVSGVILGTTSITYLISATGCAANLTVSVDPVPSGITGNLPVCAGNTFNLTDGTSGGTWSSSNTTVATVGSGSGAVTGRAGVLATTIVTITYTLPTGCNTTVPVTVNPIPVAITGSHSVCFGLSTCLTDVTVGGTWSTGNTNIATIGTGGCITTATLSGTVNIVYSIPTGCNTSTIFTVNPLPLNISGVTAVCSGSSIILSDAGGGTWSSSSSTVSVNSTSGSVTGIVAGPATASITYTLPTSCVTNTIITINPLPVGITGPIDAVCVGSNITLSDAAGSGTWSSTNTNASIGSTGIVLGVNAGTATISYTISTGCAATQVVTVEPLPAGISGSPSLCYEVTTNLTDATPGGTWSSSNSAIAPIGSSSGAVYGNALGTATITYTLPTGCINTMAVTVNSLPSLVSYVTVGQVCPGSSISLTAPSTGGSWSSSNTAIATAASASGVVTGVAGGTVNITYTVGTGCYSTALVTVYPAPATISGAANICLGSSPTLSDATTPGTWTSSNALVATIGSSSGTITDFETGTSTISYTLPSGCATTLTVTVVAAVTAISSNDNVCSGLTTTLTDATTGGTWSSTSTTVSVNSTSGGVTGVAVSGTATITYTLGSCKAYTPFTVNPLPAGITGPNTVCVGLTISLTDVTPGGTWSGNNGDASIGSTGIVTGLAPGPWVATFTLPTGCVANATVTVNPVPNAITGSGTVCSGATLNLSDGITGGTWTSSNTIVAIVGSSSGIVTGQGVAPGTATISYILPTGCYATTVVSVIVAIPAISGTASNCPQFNISLSDGVTGGTWTSSNTGIATVGSTGTVVDVTPGTATITYSIGGICTVNKIVTFNNVPAIPGAPNINMCYGSNPTLIDAEGGGTWTSSNGLITIGSSSGVVNAVVTGTTTISYILPGGCNTSATLTVVNTVPNILGTLTVCKGSATTLSDATSDGTWSSVSGTGSIVVGSSSGIVTGNTAGTATIVYKLGTACTTSSVVTVNPLPAIISGSNNMCQNVSITLSDATTGGSWSSSSLTLTGTGTVITVSAISTGTGTITYTLPVTGCAIETVITVNQLPSPIVGPNSVCYLSCLVETDPTGGGTWNSSDESVVYVSGGATCGLSLGTASISYVLSSTGCAISKTVTVNPVPEIISGVTTICAGLTTALTDASAGGTWSSDNAVIGSINTATGLLTGMSAGTANITYTLPTGCATDTIVTILQSPTAILGSPAICLGNSTTLSDTTSGGSWSSSNTAVVNVGFSTGLVSSSATGTSTISYTIGTGCSNTTTVTVNSFPANITGNTYVCPGSTTSLSSSTSGGVWSSSNTSIAVVNNTSGVVTGVSGGVVNITYTTPAGCYVTTTLNVFNVVGAITSASDEVCQGLTLNLSDATAGGTWSSSNSAIATVGSSTGLVTGVTLGSVITTFTAPSGCFSTATITVINGLPAITGSTFAVCPGFSITLSDVSTGGVWSSSSPDVSVAPSTGIITGVSAGTANITYSIGAGCTVTTTVTVNGQPIAGLKTICVGSFTTLSDVESGGLWSSASTSVLVGSLSGIVTGLVSAPAVITYSSPLGCVITTTVSVLNSVPDFIALPSLLCQGLTSNLIDAYSGGTWSSSNSAIATVGTSSGILTGAGAGTVTITYSLGTGCSTNSTVTINPLSPITGSAAVCRYSTTNLSDATTGGIWTSSNSNVSIDPASGIVSALTAGTSVITYTLATGCAATTNVTVNPIAEISGITNICFPGTTNLTDSVTGGTWSSSNTSVATFVATTGIFVPVSVGTATITYSLPSGCTTTTLVNIVSSIPSITGNTNDCIGVPSPLNDAITGGVWTSTNTGIAIVDAVTGSVTGQAAGSAMISYQLGASCIATTTVSVNPLPSPISGSVYVCVGLTNTLTDGTTGGAWTSGNTSVATVVSGVVTGVSAGATGITYSTPAGCVATTVATVNPLPTAIYGIENICSGSTTTLHDTTAGGSWTSVNTSVGSIGAGTGIATGISAGTSTIVYTLPTGCITTALLNVVNSVNPISGSTLTMCIGASVSLSDALTGGAWTTSNTNASVGSSSGIVTGASAGTSTIIYTLGTSCNATIVVTVNAGPPAISGIMQVCYGSTTTLDDATSGGTWSVSNGNITIGSSSGFVSSINAGVDTVTYTVNTGCKTTSVFTVNALPTVYSVGPGGSYCAGGTGVSVVLNGSNVGVNYFLYYGATPEGSRAGTGDTLTFGPETLAGTYTIKASNATTGCLSYMLDTATVSITPNVVPGVSISSGGGDTVCVGTYTTFNAIPVNGGSTPGYEWLVNGVSPGADSSHYSYVPSDGDVVSVILTSNALCVLPDTAAASVVMTVHTIKTPSVAISIAPHDTLCAGTVAQFTAVDSFGGAAPVFTWYKNGSVAATGSVFTFTPYAPDNGDVIYCKMASDYGCVTTDTASSGYIRITVDSSLIPHIAMSATPGTIICSGQSDTLVATVTDAGALPTYQWFVNTTLIPGATTNTFISDTLSNGDSVICVVLGSGECGLYSFNSAVITVDCNLSVQQVSAGNSDVVLIPNPNNGSFTIKGTLGTTLDEEVNIEITNVLGQVIYKNKIMAIGGKINEQIRLSSALSNGMYSLSMHAANESKVFHLVIEQ